jgi:membrane protein YqaA with SNARE-associated domain
MQSEAALTTLLLTGLYPAWLLIAVASLGEDLAVSWAR